MSYIAVTEPQSNPFAPLTSELVKQLRDNPLAIAQGLEGAPKVSGRALDVYLGELARSATTSPIGVIDLDRWDEILLIGSARNAQISFTQDNGGTWGSWQTLYITAPGASFGRFVVSKSQGQVAGGYMFTSNISGENSQTVSVSNSLTIPAASNGFRLRNTNSDSTVSFNFSAFLIGGTP